MTFVDGILIVNKTYSLPSDYAPGVSTIAQNAFDEMAAAAAEDGITLFRTQAIAHIRIRNLFITPMPQSVAQKPQTRYLPVRDIQNIRRV